MMCSAFLRDCLRSQPATSEDIDGLILDTEFSALAGIQFEISQADPSKSKTRFQKYDEIRQRCEASENGSGIRKDVLELGFMGCDATKALRQVSRVCWLLVAACSLSPYYLLLSP